jgi:hypothetical protein
MLIVAVAGCRTTSNLRLTDYYDTREFPMVNVTGAVVHADAGTRLFGFTDLGSGVHGPRYLELQVSQPIYRGFGGVTEYNREFKSPRGTNRLGVFYQPPLPPALARDRLSFKYTPLSTHDVGAQLGVSATKFLGLHAYVDGYFEFNVKPGTVVTEWQFGRRLMGPVYAVAELRHNGMKAEPKGVGLGIEWKVK